jgi:hypothetical protein
MSTVVQQQSAATLDQFVALSAILTGIAAANLKPFLDTHGTAQAYFDIASTRGGAPFTQMMSIFVANQSQPPQTIGQLILQQSGDDVAYMAKSVMLLWYLASWYEPAALKAYKADPLKNPAQFTVVSSDAYTQGWVWRVGQTHPMGYSTWRFGYWNTTPAPLSAFIGGGQ